MEACHWDSPCDRSTRTGIFIERIATYRFQYFYDGTSESGRLDPLKIWTTIGQRLRANFAPAATLIDVTTIDELAKLAERHSTVILHMTLNSLHCYLVQCNGITYRYVFSTGKRGVAEIEPPRQEIAEYTINVNENNIVEAQPAVGDLVGYVINKSRIANVEVEETVMLRKLRL